MNINKQILNRAFAQTVAAAVSFEDEQTGSRAYKALTKAMAVIETNPTLEMEKGVLTFISKDSGKKRIVTKDGCYETCECQNQYSYHQAAFQIISRYTELLPKPQIEKSWIHDATTPYLKPTNNKPAEKIAGIRIN